MKLEGKILEKEFKLTWTQVKECFIKGSKEKDSNSTVKRKCKMKYTKKQKRNAIYGWSRI